MQNPNSVAMENIEERRRSAGIDDVELRIQIRDLKAGDFVKLTLLRDAASAETVLVRITSIKASAFRGKLAKKPVGAGLSAMKIGTPLVFSSVHIHSLAKAPLSPG